MHHPHSSRVQSLWGFLPSSLIRSHDGDIMPRTIRHLALAALSFCAIVTLPAAAQGRTGGLSAQCNIMGQPVQLDLSYEAIGGAGVTYGPGVNPDITGVIGDGSTTLYWTGAFRSAQGTLPLSGENRFLRFYDANVYNRETVLEVTTTGGNSFYLTDVYGNYPGNHPCQITQIW